MVSATKPRPLSLTRDELPRCPQNLDAERSTLGAILVNNDHLTKARSVVRAEDFFLPLHRYIFRAIVRLVDAGNPADLITVNQTLQDSHEIDDADGVPYLASLVDGIPRITHVEHYARIVKETALKRQILNAMELVQHNALNGSTAKEILDGAIRDIQNLQKEALVEDLSGMSTSQLFDVSGNETEWLAFPFAAPGLSSILDALPKMGKTRFFLEGILASRNSRPFLGHATKPMRVVFVSEQSSVSLAGQVRQTGFTELEHITYDSFGKLTASTGSLTNPFQYTARESDSETGLYYYRARYYDLNVGRFLTEDPVGFNAGPNFYRYVRNNPALLIDPTGLITTLPPDPRQNTVVCKEHGRMGIQLGNLATLGGPKEIECLEDCARVHEESHLADDKAANPKICKGQSPGVMVGFSNPAEQKVGEIKASNAELDCLRDKLEHGCKKDGCGPIILNRIGDVRAYRDYFKSQP